MSKILVPLDGSELSERILVHVHRLLVRKDAEITLLRVVSEKAAAQVFPPGQNELATARRDLERLREALIDNGAQAKARVAIGEPAAQILDVARELDATLIAMATHGRSGIARFTRGSVAERVLRASKTPVLLANPHALPAHRGLAMKRILVPLDFSEMSAQALPLAVEIAKSFEAELVLMHSLETVVVPDPIVMVSATMTIQEATSILQDRFAKRVQGVPVRIRVALGSPALNILDVATEESVDMIAMTTHGRSGISRWAAGSVAEHVLRHATCPLLVQRTAGFAGVDRVTDAA